MTAPSPSEPLIGSVIVDTGPRYETMFTTALIVIAVGSVCTFPVSWVR